MIKIPGLIDGLFSLIHHLMSMCGWFAGARCFDRVSSSNTLQSGLVCSCFKERRHCGDWRCCSLTLKGSQKFNQPKFMRTTAATFCWKVRVSWISNNALWWMSLFIMSCHEGMTSDPVAHTISLVFQCLGITLIVHCRHLDAAEFQENELNQRTQFWSHFAE